MSSDEPLEDRWLRWPVPGPPPPNYPRQSHGWPSSDRRRYCPFPWRALAAWIAAIIIFFGGGLLLAHYIKTTRPPPTRHGHAAPTQRPPPLVVLPPAAVAPATTAPPATAADLSRLVGSLAAPPVGPPG
jgi:hypothetical protein